MSLIKQDPHLLTDDNQAIAALCTPRGSGALALIRISGSDAIDVADSVAQLSSGKKLRDVASHTVHHGRIITKHNEIIDEVMFIIMYGPKTFTGQHTVEITCHNNHFIIEQILDLLIGNGARLAQAGEFTKRAFLSGKIDLIKAEAINEIINAPTELALRQSMSTLQGSLSHHIYTLEIELVNLLGYVEASFEFLDEEQRTLNFNQTIIDRTNDLINKIKTLKVTFANQKQIRDGIRIAILGVVNAGKSTLFNALIKKNRAIVADMAGTTRDSIESSLYHKGNFLLFIDTAGIRQTHDHIEQQGIERSFTEAAAADIILLTIDATKNLNTEQLEQYVTLLEQYRKKIIVVINKIDENNQQFQFQNQDIPTVKVSAKSSMGIDTLQEIIDTKIQTLFAQLHSPFLLNQRHFKLLTEIELRLESIAKEFENSLHYELVAYKLKDLLEKTSLLTGRNVSEQVLDTVFNEFCVGK